MALSQLRIRSPRKTLFITVLKKKSFVQHWQLGIPKLCAITSPPPSPQPPPFCSLFFKTFSEKWPKRALFHAGATSSWQSYIRAHLYGYIATIYEATLRFYSRFPGPRPRVLGALYLDRKRSYRLIITPVFFDIKFEKHS